MKKYIPLAAAVIAALCALFDKLVKILTTHNKSNA